MAKDRAIKELFVDMFIKDDLMKEMGSMHIDKSGVSKFAMGDKAVIST
jgi:hypothetical protein